MKLKKIIIYLWVSFSIFILFSLLFLSAIGYNWMGWFGGMPSLESLENPKVNLSSELWSADGKLLGKYYRENRTRVKLHDISPHLLHALLATEDIRFFEHSGIDLIATMAIPYYFITGSTRGSSTISQQLARNLFVSRAKKYEGDLFNIFLFEKIITKIKDWFLTIKIERSYTKNEILTMYFNSVDFGSNSFGIQVACKTYFDVEPKDISIQDAATIIGLLKATTKYNPILNYENSLNRRNIVLTQMGKYGFITNSERDSLVQLPINLSKYQADSHNKGLAPYFRAHAQQFLFNWCKKKGIDLYGDGIKIYTTIETQIQEKAEKAVKKHLKHYQKLFFNHWENEVPWRDENRNEIENFLEINIQKTDIYATLQEKYGEDSVKIAEELHIPKPMKVFSWEGEEYEKDTVLSSMDSLKYYKHFLQTGLIAMSPYSGHIKAWVGGINHKYFKYDHVKMGKRQTGSVFKPILYATVFSEKEFTPCSQVLDIPTTFRLEDGSTWTPKNSSNKYTGQLLSLRQALARSVNTVAAYLISQVTPQRVVYYANKKFGIKSRLYGVPSLSLGTSNISVYEMVGAYCTFLNRGVWIEPIFITHIEDKDGKLIHRFVPHKVEALSEKVAFMMLDILKGGIEEKGGTSLGLRRYEFTKKNEFGGKTGTTANYSDAWYIGMTKDLVTGVWVGNEDRSVHFRTITLGQGSKQAMPIFAYFYESLYDEKNPFYIKGIFPKPQNNFNYDKDCFNVELNQFEYNERL